jgi:AhpD family alkylhydroperoxidase
MTVSQATACAYCIDMNAGMLINMFGWTPEQVAATQANAANANLEERETALLLFILKAVKESNNTTQADVDALRAVGYSDADIFDGLLLGARMVAADIVSNALHVERDF